MQFGPHQSVRLAVGCSHRCQSLCISLRTLQFADKNLCGLWIRRTCLPHAYVVCEVTVSVIVAHKRQQPESAGSILAEYCFQRCHPRSVIVEGSTVPCVVGDAVEGNLAHLALLHRIADESVYTLDIRVESSIAVDMRLVVEVAVHVEREELVHVVVITRIVPPPCHVTSEPRADKFRVFRVGHCPYGTSCDIDAHLPWSVAQRTEETLALLALHP